MRENAKARYYIKLDKYYSNNIVIVMKGYNK